MCPRTVLGAVWSDGICFNLVLLQGAFYLGGTFDIATSCWVELEVALFCCMTLGGFSFICITECEN